MGLADKIMSLRKRQGWSQEELADQCGVSRQSVSKWESGQSAPDLDKILILSQIFGVTTDFLLKDNESFAVYNGPAADALQNIQSAQFSQESEEPGEQGAVCEDLQDVQDMQNRRASQGEPERAWQPLKRVSLEEAIRFMDHEAAYAPQIALGVALCILSPVLLIVFSGFAADGHFFLSENQVCALGVITLLILVACAVSIFIRYGMSSSEFEYLRCGQFELAYGVEAEIKSRSKDFAPVFSNGIIVGVTLCILSVVPLLLFAIMEVGDGLLIASVGILLVIVAVAVNRMVRVGLVKGSFDLLLKTGDYEKFREGREKSILEVIAPVYWLLIVAAYLAFSFLTNRWEKSWLIWPIAGVVFAAIAAVCNYTESKDR